MENEVKDANYQGVRQVVWGLVLVLISIRINRIDIFPDSIGYILVAIGLGKLTLLSEDFSKAQKFAALLIAFALTSLYEVPSTTFPGFESSTLSLALLLLGGVAGVLKLFMVYYICQGFIELTDKEEDKKYFANLTKGRWGNYLYLNSVFLVLQPFVFNVSEQTVMVGVMISVPIIIIMEILFIHLVHRFGKEIVNRETVVQEIP